MADSLYELLRPHLGDKGSPSVPSLKDPTTTTYLARLATLPLASLDTTESQSLAQSSQSHLISLQALSTRSHKSIIASTTHLSTLRTSIPTLAHASAGLRDALPRLDEAAIHFSETYNTHNTTENKILDRRRKALLLSRNIDRLTDILDLPTLLSSTIPSSSGSVVSQGSSNASYASALDLNNHVKRLHTLYPDSPLIGSIARQAEDAMQTMTTNLIASLRHPLLKLAAAIRTISWLRRVAPELDSSPFASQDPSENHEGSLGSLFLVCRLATLRNMLQALGPLRELGDQETLQRESGKVSLSKGSWESGQQTEKYLKRYIEIFREQSFAIISMYRSIFPASSHADRSSMANPLQPLPSTMGTFPLKLIGMLEATLKHYLPNIRDKSSRDGLLTQVLYCAGSLGRLGGDFSLLLATLQQHGGQLADERNHDPDDSDDEAWVEVIKKHRVLAGKLDLMVGASKVT